MDVGEREHLPRPELDEHVLAPCLGRVDQRVARDDVQAVAPVRPAERAGDLARVALRLLEADDLGAGRLDRLDHLAEVDDVAAEPDVEGHHAHVRGRGRGDGAVGPGEQEQHEEGDRAAHGRKTKPAATRTFVHSLKEPLMLTITGRHVLVSIRTPGRDPAGRRPVRRARRHRLGGERHAVVRRHRGRGEPPLGHGRRRRLHDHGPRRRHAIGAGAGCFADRDAVAGDVPDGRHHRAQPRRARPRRHDRRRLRHRRPPRSPAAPATTCSPAATGPTRSTAAPTPTASTAAAAATR